MNQRLQGIVLMVAAMAVFTVLDTTAKYVMQSLPAAVAVFFRYLIALAISTAVVLRAGGPALAVARHPVLQIGRGLLVMVSTALNFAAMRHLQLAQTAAIFFTVPLWVCALSVPLLGERVGKWRWLAVVAGFLGVLLIMRPGTAGFHWAMLYSIGSAFCGAIYNILTRKVGGADRAETSLFYVGLIGCLAAAAPLPWTWRMPQGGEWLLLALIWLAGSVGHFLLIEAHRKAAASLLAPFIYSQIVWMILTGFIVFGDVPDGWTLAGATIVAASGLFILARERWRARHANSGGAPMRHDHDG